MELRFHIYRFLLVERDAVELTTLDRKRTFKVPALLQVSRQVREEASYIWYGLNRFVITVRHGETALVRAFLVGLASLRSPAIGRLNITLNTCFQCNDLVATAALLLASNVQAKIRCIRRLYHVGDPQISPCVTSVAQSITEQNFRPSIATALLKCTNPQLVGAGLIMEGK